MTDRELQQSIETQLDRDTAAIRAVAVVALGVYALALLCWLGS